MNAKLVLGSFLCVGLTALAFFILLPLGRVPPISLGIASFAFGVSRALLFAGFASQRLAAVADALLLVAFATGILLVQSLDY
jgi:hypothetical protein